MILSDRAIRQLVHERPQTITPFNPSMVQPSSLDVRLGNSFQVFRRERVNAHVDPREENAHITQEVIRNPNEPMTLYPGNFVLGTTLETVDIPDDVVAQVEGKSSIGRLGVAVHITAGYIDPGFKGQITLELHNCNKNTIALWPGMAIAQLVFMRMDGPAEFPYGHPELNSKYQGQVGATASKYFKN